MSQKLLGLMQIYRLAAREVTAHCDDAATQNAALEEFAERLRKKGWQTPSRPIRRGNPPSCADSPRCAGLKREFLRWKLD